MRTFLFCLFSTFLLLASCKNKHLNNEIIEDTVEKEDSLVNNVFNVHDTLKYYYKENKILKVKNISLDESKIYTKIYCINNDNEFDMTQYNHGKYGLGLMKNEPDVEKYTTQFFKLEVDGDMYFMDLFNLDVFLSKLNYQSFPKMLEQYRSLTKVEHALSLKQNKERPIKLYDTKTEKFLKTESEIGFDYLREIKIDTIKNKYFAKIALYLDYNVEEGRYDTEQYLIDLKEINSYSELIN